MQPNAIPSSVSFYPSGAQTRPTATADTPAPPPAPTFVPLLPEDMNLRGMTKRALSMITDGTVNVLV